MTGKEKKAELLAPAGNYESFLGAIHAGADAVYLGGEKFGARAYAGNFSAEELCRAIRYAHLSNRKVYLTLNTLVKESEFAEIRDYLTPFYETGLDGVILQDLGVLAYVRENFPALPLHISTQAAVTGVYGARFLKEQGAVRIVPARELSLDELRYIKEETGLEMEVFVHGAMCYCYSGQCLFSSIAGGRSGNRGRCAQPCRLPYRLKLDGKEYFTKESYPLSLKDLCTIRELPALLAAGMDSLKIEGRMKKPEYAAGVTAIYRKYLDAYYEHPEDFTEKGRKESLQIAEADFRELSSIYIRSGIQNGYFFRRNGREMITLDSPAYSGSDEKVLQAIREKYLIPEKKIPIAVHLVCKEGEALTLTLQGGDKSVTEAGPEVETALSRPVESSVLEERVCRFGNTFFEVGSCLVDVDDHSFISLKAVNELRRAAADKLEDAILKQKNDTFRDICKAGLMDHNQETKIEAVRETKQDRAKKLRQEFSVLVFEREQLEECLARPGKFRRIYLDCDLYEQITEDPSGRKIFSALKEQQEAAELFLSLPFVVRNRGFFTELSDRIRLFPIDGFLVRNVEEMGWLKVMEQHAFVSVAFDAGMYCFNRKTAQFYFSFGDTICLPYELTSREKRQLRSLMPEGSFEQVAYGRIPMMVTVNCLNKTAFQCDRQKKRMILTDRYRHEFPVDTVCRHCYNIIWNCLPLSLHDKLQDYQDCLLRLQFTTENGAETGKIMDYFLNGGVTAPGYEYTTGHEKRGVE